MPSISEMLPRHHTRRMPSMKGSLLVAIAILLPVASCDKTIVEPSATLPAVEAASIDANAGAWKMIVLAGPDQVAVPDPTAVTSPAYLAELQAVKTAQAN